MNFLENTDYWVGTRMCPHHEHNLATLRERHSDLLQKPYICSIDVSKKRPYAMLDQSPCLCATQSKFFIPLLNRYLEPRECYNLHGFPQEFVMCKYKSYAYRQAGNTMSVCVLKPILKNLLALIEVGGETKTSIITH